MKLRPATDQDVDAIVALFDAGKAAYEEPYSAEEELRQWLTSPKVDLARDVRLAPEQDRLVAYVDVDPLGADPVRWWCDVRVHPDADVGRVVPELLAWAEGRAGGGILRTWAPSSFTPLQREYERAGLRRIRASYRMEIDLSDDPPLPVFPEGVEVRTLREGEERLAYEVHDETFQDSWEHTREPYEEWEHYLLKTESFDPSLWFLAWAGDEPAGIAICRVRPGIGWIGILGVRRPWRRHGLGRALLLHAFHEFRRRGLSRAGLGVDAESLTGANRLYESAGMHVARQLDFFEKQVVPGA